MNKIKRQDDSDDSDLSRSPEQEENVRYTYVVRRETQSRNMTLKPSQPKGRLEKAEMKRMDYSIYRGRYDSDEEGFSPSFQGRESPPITTSFRRKDRQVKPIRELIDKPWRHRRPSKICIFIRGPPLSGKSYIAECILEREKQYGNDKALRINGVHQHDDNDRESRGRNSNDRDGPKFLFDQFHNAAKLGCKFLVVEVKSHKRAVFETCTHLARTYDYEMYGIDIMVDLESKSYKSRLRDIRLYSYETLTNAYMKEMKAFPMPYFVTMVNPIGIFPNTFKIPFYMSQINDFSKNHNYGQPETCKDDFSAVDDAYYDIATVKNIYEYFPEGIRYSVNFEDDVVEKVGDLIVNKTQAPYKSVIDLHLEKFPSFEPSEVIEYDHKPKIIDDGKILEVNPNQILDYSHNRTQYLMNLVADVDIDAVIEKKKAEKMEEKLNYYKPYEKKKGMKTSVYPQNWELIEVERPPLHGKRKKKKTQKILRVLDQKSVKNVQKGVKRMKLDEKNSQSEEQQDSFMDVENEASTAYYIDEIIKKTTIDGLIEENNQEAFDYIRTFYTRLDAIPEMFTILQLVSQVDHLKIQFSLNDGEAYCFNPKENLMEIYVNDLGEAEILRTLGHQLMHCAAHWTYKNNAKPYTEDDDDRKDELQRIFIEMDIIESENHEEFRKTMSKYCESVWDVEVVGIFGEMIVDGKTEELKKVHNLWEFYMKMMDEIESFGRRLRSETKLGVF